MYSNRFGCQFIDLVTLYRESDRDCTPSDWLPLLHVRNQLEESAKDLGCEVADIVIRRGKGASAVCWVHPNLVQQWQAWADKRGSRRTRNSKASISKQTQQQDIPFKAEVVESAESFVDFAEWQPTQIEAIAKSSEPFPVDFDKAWKWVGYTRKDNAKRVLVNNFKEGLDYRVFLRSEENPIKPIGGRPNESIHLTTDCFKKFCMMAGTAVGEAVRNYYLECERRLHEVKYQFQPQPQPTTAATPFLDMIEQDLVRLGVGEAFILRWKYSALKALNPQHSKIFEEALRLVMPACAEEKSRVNVGTISDLIRAKYKLEIPTQYLNQIWVEMGFQIKTRTAKCRWALTDEGEKMASQFPTTMKTMAMMDIRYSG